VAWLTHICGGKAVGGLCSRGYFGLVGWGRLLSLPKLSAQSSGCDMALLDGFFSARGGGWVYPAFLIRASFVRCVGDGACADLRHCISPHSTRGLSIRVRNQAAIHILSNVDAKQVDAHAYIVKYKTVPLRPARAIHIENGAACERVNMNMTA